MLIRWKSKDKAPNKSSTGDGSGSKKKRKFGKEEEEWNVDNKYRYSNESDAEILSKTEGTKANDPSSRRIGGIGIGITNSINLSLQGRNTGVVSGRSHDDTRRHISSADHQTATLMQHQQCPTVPACSNTVPLTSQVNHPLHPRHLLSHHSQLVNSSRINTTEHEMGTKSRSRKMLLSRGYPPPSSAMLFDDDPGIMSEVETSSTGFRRGGKQRSSLPVVRTPSKTLERPLGLVFLQYRNETKRALLPNEITSIDTVKALFVRSFSKQLTMEYLDSLHVKIYIHDSNKDMFYELEDLRSHLRDIRDRSVLRLFESDGVAGMPGSLGVSVGSIPSTHWEDQSYFSEPEFDSEFQHQHIHKSKNAKHSSTGSGLYTSRSNTLPRSGALLRSYSPRLSVLSGTSTAILPDQPKSLVTPDQLHGESGYMSSPERGNGETIGPISVNSTGTSSCPNATTSSRYPSGSYSGGSSYEDPYYSQYSGTATPVIDEEARLRVEHMERQLANLTGLVQKALTHTPQPTSSPRDFLQVPAGRDPYIKSGDEIRSKADVKPPKLSRDKSVSFEKSVSFSDEPPDMSSPKQHSPQYTADSKPTKPAIKSSTLPRMSSQEREKSKPIPPPKPMALAAGQYVYRDLTLTPEMYNQLRSLQKKTKDLRQDVKNLKRMSQSQAHTVRETIRDTFITIRTMLLSNEENIWASVDTEALRLSQEQELYKQEMAWLEKDLAGLENTVEELRGNVINRKTRVNMSDVENMALILSKASKTVADLKVRFPNLQDGMKGLLSSEMEKVMKEEKFLKEEPDRLESALKRCKKLTGTLVTLKRLASVQEQRLPNSNSVEVDDAPITPTSGQQTKQAGAAVPTEHFALGSAFISGGSCESAEPSDYSSGYSQRSENALDALLDELQTFNRPVSSLSQVSSISAHQQQITCHLADLTDSISGSIIEFAECTDRSLNISDTRRKNSIDSSCLSVLQPCYNGTLRRLHSYPSSSDTDTSPPVDAKDNNSSNHEVNVEYRTAQQVPAKPPLPERNAELLQIASTRRIPPPPPPRTTSRSPLDSPTSPQLPPRNSSIINLTVSTLRGSQPSRLIKSCSENNDKIPNELKPSAVPNNIKPTSNSSSCESINSQDGLQFKKGRQEQLEKRHQELLRKQKALQEQYARLQQLQRNTSSCSTNMRPISPDFLKKTGSESNLLTKIDSCPSTITTSGSLISLSTAKPFNQSVLPDFSSTIVTERDPELVNILSSRGSSNNKTINVTTTSKVYETDIL